MLRRTRSAITNTVNKRKPYPPAGVHIREIVTAMCRPRRSVRRESGNPQARIFRVVVAVTAIWPIRVALQPQRDASARALIVAGVQQHRGQRRRAALTARLKHPHNPRTNTTIETIRFFDAHFCDACLNQCRLLALPRKRERVRSPRTRQQSITILQAPAALTACRASYRSRTGRDAAGACSSGRTRRCRCRRPSGSSRYGARRAWRPFRRSPGRRPSG